MDRMTPSGKDIPGTPAWSHDNDNSTSIWRSDAPIEQSNFDMTTGAGRSMLIKLMGSADRPLSDCVGKIILCEAWLLHTITQKDRQTGHEQPARRLVFRSKDGATVATSSACVIDRFMSIVRLSPKGLFTPQIWFKVKLTKGSGRGGYLEIEDMGTEGEP